MEIKALVSERLLNEGQITARSFAKEIGVNIRTIQRILKDLERDGSIEIDFRQMGRNGYVAYAIQDKSLLREYAEICGKVRHKYGKVRQSAVKMESSKAALDADCGPILENQRNAVGGISPRGGKITTPTNNTREKEKKEKKEKPTESKVGSLLKKFAG